MGNAIEMRLSPPAAGTQAAGYKRAERGLASSIQRLAALPRLVAREGRGKRLPVKPAMTNMYRAGNDGQRSSRQ